MLHKALLSVWVLGPSGLCWASDVGVAGYLKGFRAAGIGMLR